MTAGKDMGPHLEVYSTTEGTDYSKSGELIGKYL